MQQCVGIYLLIEFWNKIVVQFWHHRGDNDRKVKVSEWLPNRIPVSSIEDAIYNMDKSLNFSGKYVEKYRACLALLVQLHINNEVINFSVTHPQILLDK